MVVLIPPPPAPPSLDPVPNPIPVPNSPQQQIAAMFRPKESLQVQTHRLLQAAVADTVGKLVARNQMEVGQESFVQGLVYSVLADILPKDLHPVPTPAIKEDAGSKVLPFQDYGLGMLYGKHYCFVCNQTVVADRGGQIDHVLSAKHDETLIKTGSHSRASVWHLRDLRASHKQPKGIAKRGSLSQDERKRKAVENVAAAHSERKLRRTEFHDPLNSAKPAAECSKERTLIVCILQEN